MKRVLTAGIPACILAVLVAAVAASGRQPDRAQTAPGTSITIIEHAVTDSTTDTGAHGDTTGDLLTFHNNVFDATDTRKVGRDQGYCVRMVPGKSYECTWSTLLKGGHIVVAGPYYDKRDSVEAITGGTGRYRDARGSSTLHAFKNGTRFRIVFRVTP
jgi:hypothetical protein